MSTAKPTDELAATAAKKVSSSAEVYDDDTFEDEAAEAAEEAEENEEEELEEGTEEEDEEEEDDDEEEEEEEEDEEEEEEEQEPTLSIKVAREGEPNVKVFVVKKHTKFDTLLAEITNRFGFGATTDYVLYAIDESNDRVDIDTAHTFKMVIKPHWPRKTKHQAIKLYLREATGVARPATAATPAPSTIAQRQTSNTGFLSNPPQQELTSPVSTTMLQAAFSQGRPLQWKKMSMLGKGSFGTVYEGLTNDGKIVAVKVQDLPQDEDSQSDDVKSLMSEINLMQQLNHTNIVAYYGCQTTEMPTGGRQMEIFLEYCSGGTLSTIRKRYDAVTGRLSLSLARSYTRQVLEGLLYLHQRGVMHRDLKSDNVLISAAGVAKLADFGCSKRIGTATMAANGGSGDPLYQTMVGTPLFMAPEVMNDAGPGYSMPADIWSVGCIVIELLGSRPWLVQGNNLFQVMYQISQSKDMPSGIPKDSPPQLMDFFRCCFERDASKRATAQQLLQHEWLTCPEEALQDFLSAA